MKVLNVAEKPSIAKSIAKILSNNSFNTRRGPSKYNNNFDFIINNKNVPYLTNNNSIDIHMTVTSVSGHVMNYEFPSDYKWGKVNPIELFNAPINHSINNNSKDIAKNLEKECINSNALIIWTDCDREGEAIGKYIFF